jgi:MFS family permease
MVGTVFGAVFGLALVASGLAADMLGRKRVLVAGTLLFSVGILGSGFAVAFGFFMYASLVWLFKRDYIADGEPQGGRR